MSKSLKREFEFVWLPEYRSGVRRQCSLHIRAIVKFYHNILRAEAGVDHVAYPVAASIETSVRRNVSE